MEIYQLPVLQDNYIYILYDPIKQVCGCVDPAQAEPVIDFLEQRGWSLDFILNTHHHNDHVGGNKALKARYDCQVIGAAHDSARIPAIDQKVAEGDQVALGAASAQVFDVAGHTTGHIAYYFADQKALFCGDTLFSLGCGRLFEGSPQQMWGSLQKLRALGDDVKVYCAHEYTAANGTFAQHVDPDNESLAQYCREVKTLREAGKPTIPADLGQEKQINPFLRADDVALKAAVGMAQAADVDVFAEIRKRKDNF